MLFNPLEQERLSVVSLLVSSPRVCVFSEEGQPLAVQMSAHWSSATDMVPDVYQVRWGSALALCSSLASVLQHQPPTLLLSPRAGDRNPGERGCPEDGHLWDLSLALKGRWRSIVKMAFHHSTIHSSNKPLLKAGCAVNTS